MSQLGPESFEIRLSDWFETLNPSDPIVGIDVTAIVPVVVNWDLSRAGFDLPPNEKEVTFGEVRWEGAGAGPHDLFEEKLMGIREKIGTLLWSISLTFFKTVQTNGDTHRWLITPCPTLYRTITGKNAGKTEVINQPTPCPGSWVKTPAAVVSAVAESVSFARTLRGEPPAPKRRVVHARTERPTKAAKSKGKKRQGN